MAFGPEAGLALLAALRPPALRGYPPLPAARADLLLRSAAGEARAEFERAAGLSRNARERAFLLARARPAAALDMWRRSGCAVAATAVRSDVPIPGRPEIFLSALKHRAFNLTRSRLL